MATTWHTGLYLILTLCLITVSQAGRILVMPGNVNSHLLFMGQTAAALQGEGHEVTFMTPSNAKVPDVVKERKVEVLVYQTEGETSLMNSREFSELMVKIALSKSLWETILANFKVSPLFQQQAEIDCKSKFQEGVIQEVKKRNFDVALVDGTTLLCDSLLPYSLNIPYIPVSILGGPLAFRIPALPSFVPAYLTTYSDEMTFKERFLNTILHLTITLGIHFTQNYAEIYVPDKPIQPMEIITQSAFWFALDDISFSYPSPGMPNIAFLGDIMARPAKPLPKDIKTFLDNSKDGVILVSLGSFFHHVPYEIVEKFCTAFTQVGLTVIWKLNDPKLCDQGPNKVKIMSWMPQNDILGHPKVKLFITHGGLNSIVESIYHAKPMIVFPIAIDQPGNAAKIQNKNLGYKLDIADFTADTLAESIRNILSDKMVQTQIQIASGILREKPETPAERASFWISHVIEHGNSHLRTSAYNLNIFQFLMFDIYLFLLVVAILIIIVMIFVCFYCLKCLKKRCRKPKEKQQ